MSDEWEARMAARARERRTVEEATIVVEEAEGYLIEALEPDEVDVYTGVCDVCGEDISYEHRRSRGVIDYAIEEIAETSYIVVTWIRHHAVPHPGKDPRCAYYFSPVRRMVDTQGEDA